MNPNKHKWDSKSHGTKFGHNFFYFTIRFGGRKVAYFFLYFVAFNYAILFPSIIKKTAPYLKKQFPDAGFFQRAGHRYLLILNFGRILIDRAIVGILGPKSINASFRNYERMKTIESGFILLICHAGGWQVAMSALDALDKPVNFLMLRDEKDIDKQYYEHNENPTKINIINPEQFLGGSIEILAALKNDEIVCMMGDRIFSESDRFMEMDFLKGKAMFPFSAFKMSSISQKPIVVLYSYKQGPCEYETYISTIIHVPPKLGKHQEKYRPYVETFIKSLESFVKDHPYQFFNFFDMWHENHEEPNEE